jgi:hypothetical protein
MTMTATMTMMPRAGAYMLAVAADKFAVVDPEDFGFALYAVREWQMVGGVVRGCGPQKGVTLARLVADRMGYASDVPVTHRDDDPLNCRRYNIYCTPYVWRRGTITRVSFSQEVKVVGRGKKKKEVREDVEHKTEEAGWLYGNVAVYQGGRGGQWTLIHVPTGRAFGAFWYRVADAKLGVELMHAEGDFATIPDDGSFTAGMGKKWRDLVHRRSNRI